MVEVSLLIVYSQYLWIWQPCYADGFDLRARACAGLLVRARDVFGQKFFQKFGSWRSRTTKRAHLVLWRESQRWTEDQHHYWYCRLPCRAHPTSIKLREKILCQFFFVDNFLSNISCVKRIVECRQIWQVIFLKHTSL